MREISVAGVGAVSPAGWNARSLWEAVDGSALTAGPESISNPRNVPLTGRCVPEPPADLTLLRHPRLRRSGRIGRYTVAAAGEALLEAADWVSAPESKVGFVFCTTCGPVRYSERFYQEVLNNPAEASPLIFPETVFNAPASHLSAVLGFDARNYTLVGDAAAVARAVAMAAHWLREGALDACVVAAAEESDWLIADAFHHFNNSIPTAEGAGAMVLVHGDRPLPRLDCVTDALLYTQIRSRRAAAQEAARQLAPFESGELLISGLSSNSRLDRDEADAWRDWNGRHIQLKAVFGEAFCATAIWQCVAAVVALRQGAASSACVSLVGNHQSAAGLRFSKPS